MNHFHRFALTILVAATMQISAAEPTPLLDSLSRESAEIKRDAPEKWKDCDGKFSAVLAENMKIRSHWFNRGSPPQPDFKPLKLPLAFLIEHLLLAAKESRTHWYVVNGLLDAVAVSSDPRRIDALLEFAAQQKQPFEYTIAEAMTAERGTRYVIDTVKLGPTPDQQRIVRAILGRFGPSIPAGSRALVYDWLRSNWKDGPSNGNGESYWRLLFKVDVERARREVLAYYDVDDLYVIRLLCDFAGPSPLVADQARKWLRQLAAENPPQGNNYVYQTYLMIVLLKSDPKGELEHVLSRLDETVQAAHAHAAAAKDYIAKCEATRNDNDRIRDLAAALFSLKSGAADDVIAPLVHDNTLDEWNRYAMLGEFSVCQYKNFNDMLARWLREESEHARHWARESAVGKWGVFGKEALSKAEAINAAGRKDNKR